MEALRKRFSQDPAFINESAFNLQTSEANPTGREGHIPGYPVGSSFPNRAACSAARVHGKTVAGIHGTKKGAYSVCISGGQYADDIDEGDFIFYTGTGGLGDGQFGSSSSRGDGGGEVVVDQTFDHPDNAALALNITTGRPVRVVRGPSSDSPYAPSSGYRYDGLYAVKNAYYAKGRGGRTICRYELQRLPGQPPILTY